jgi:adenine deaminase
MLISGNIVDVLNSKIYPATLKILNGKIVDIIKEKKRFKKYIIPGFVDSHIHIESSMLPPNEFARVAVIHGIVAVVADPHEIANVLGVRGVKYMIENSREVPLKFYFCAPSCVPATDFETSGAKIGVKEVEQLMKLKEIVALGEVMNFPGVIKREKEVMKKIEIAKKYNKRVDGHAPGLRDKDLEKYIRASISTDHECFSKEEALEKIKLGMKILIRLGSAAKNFDALISLIEKYPEMCMFCSDDKHPDDLIKGYINEMVKKALEYGIDLMKVLRVACVNPVLHYKLNVGLLQVNDCADFLVVDGLRNLEILRTFINGEVVAKNGKSLISKKQPKIINNFNIEKKKVEDFALYCKGEKIKVIEIVRDQIITNKFVAAAKVIDNKVISDVERDILKIVVVNRYRNEKPAIGFIKGFGLKEGAIASSVAHDSHNIIAVGVKDEYICKAVNLIIENKGGISIATKDKKIVLPLPIAGIMSDEDYFSVANKYVEIDKIAKSLGSNLKAPFMTLSFMALPVIPKLKITDKGLFDVEKFEFVNVFKD